MVLEEAQKEFEELTQRIFQRQLGVGKASELCRESLFFKVGCCFCFSSEKNVVLVKREVCCFKVWLLVFVVFVLRVLTKRFFGAKKVVRMVIYDLCLFDEFQQQGYYELWATTSFYEERGVIVFKDCLRPRI